MALTMRPSGENLGSDTTARDSAITPTVCPVRSTLTSACGSGRRRPYTSEPAAEMEALAPPAAIRNGSPVDFIVPMEKGSAHSALSTPVLRVKTTCPLGDHTASADVSPRPTSARTPSRSTAISPSLESNVTIV